jgi:site-specific DNA recombinase
MELDNLKMRIKMGKEGRAKQGKHSGGRVPFGYDYLSGGTLVINQDEAKVIQNMFQSITNGMTIASWCKLANQQGITTKLVGRWARDMACRMLKNTCYIGKGYYGKVSRSKDNRPIPMEYPRIISDELFLTVRNKLAENKIKSPCSSKHVYPLSKLGRCHCGARLGCRDSKGYRYLFCFQQADKPDVNKCYQPAYWRLEPIEDFIWGEVEDMLHNYRDGVNGILLKQLEDAKAETGTRMSRAQAELKRLADEKKRLITQVQKGVLTNDEIRINMNGIREHEEHWAQELANAQTLQIDGDAVWNDFTEKLKNVNRMYDYGMVLSDAQKKKVLNALVEEFVLEPDGQIEIRYKLPVTEKQLQETVASVLSIDKYQGNGDKGGWVHLEMRKVVYCYTFSGYFVYNVAGNY